MKISKLELFLHQNFITICSMIISKQKNLFKNRNTRIRNLVLCSIMCGPDISVYIAIGYGLDDPGIESR
jgi:hypothetical protein